MKFNAFAIFLYFITHVPENLYNTDAYEMSIRGYNEFWFIPHYFTI